MEGIASTSALNRTQDESLVRPAGERELTVALVGSPNVGKSTIFNLLTGLSQHVGNWPGKTIEQKAGVHRSAERSYRIVDLPGTYSLTANSLEEQITRDYIASQRPDAVVVVLNAASLERNLYLVAEVLELSVPVVVALNMVDVAERSGLRVEPEVLEAALGVPVVPVVAARYQGISALLEAIDEVVGVAPRPSCGRERCYVYRPRLPWLGEELEALIGQVESLLGDEMVRPYPRRWVAQKLLEGDREITVRVRAQMEQKSWATLESLLLAHEDAVIGLASARYAWIERMVRAAVHRPRVSAFSATERLDRLATHPKYGVALLLSILGFVFWLVYAVASPLVSLLNLGVGEAASLVKLHLVGAPAWLSSLLADGVLGGVGTVLSLMPILVVFFLAMALLEDVGYMARVAFVADRFMHGMGLHGKSFLPLVLGLGCNVPAALGTRIIESPRARLMTTLLVPLVPCAGRLSVLMLVAGAFFGPSAPLVALGIVSLNLTILGVSGYAVNHLLFQGERPVFIMELPLYQLPNWRTVGTVVAQRLREFVARAGTVILAASIVVWALAWLPSGTIGDSYLALVGQCLSPAGALMGLDWRTVVALLSSFVAKENAVATLAVLSSSSGDAELVLALPRMLAPAAAIAFLAVQTLFIPCVATLAAMRQETGGWRWVSAAVLYLFALSFGVGIVIYQGASLLGWGV